MKIAADKLRALLQSPYSGDRSQEVLNNQSVDVLCSKRGYALLVRFFTSNRAVVFYI